MPDSSDETNRLLAEILLAIRKVDVSLQTHEQRIKSLEAFRGPAAPEASIQDSVRPTPHYERDSISEGTVRLSRDPHRR